MKHDTLEKLKILASAAKYDVSCASSGSNRSNTGKGLGNAAPWGICHSFTEDGRCISLLKIMLTNNCMYDCAYCVNRRSNDVKRTSLSVKELTELTISFYRRNYIEGLFLSSGVIKSPDYIMAQMTRVAKELRTLHRYNGYIHLKSIPGASPEIIREAGMYADRLSVNIEIPSEPNLKILAPEKDFASVFAPMNSISSRDFIKQRRQKKVSFGCKICSSRAKHPANSRGNS
jgi:putative DNA modification/repair radical SAM protein